MINQIRELQARRRFQYFALELSSGRVIQIYDPYCVATGEGSAAKVGILHGDSFELISVDHIVSVSRSPNRGRAPKELPREIRLEAGQLTQRREPAENYFALCLGRGNEAKTRRYAFRCRKVAAAPPTVWDFCD
jgi:hypothetical protein